MFRCNRVVNKRLPDIKKILIPASGSPYDQNSIPTRIPIQNSSPAPLRRNTVAAWE